MAELVIGSGYDGEKMRMCEKERCELSFFRQTLSFVLNLRSTGSTPYATTLLTLSDETLTLWWDLVFWCLGGRIGNSKPSILAFDLLYNKCHPEYSGLLRCVALTIW